MVARSSPAEHVRSCIIDTHYSLHCLITYREDGSITIVTRGPEFAVVKVRRSKKTNYLYKHFWDSYLLTETESKQCNVWSMEGKVPKDSYGHIGIKFDDNIHKEVEVSVHDLCAYVFVCACVCILLHE